MLGRKSGNLTLELPPICTRFTLESLPLKAKSFISLDGKKDENGLGFQSSMWKAILWMLAWLTLELKEACKPVFLRVGTNHLFCQQEKHSVIPQTRGKFLLFLTLMPSLWPPLVSCPAQVGKLWWTFYLHVPWNYPTVDLVCQVTSFPPSWMKPPSRSCVCVILQRMGSISIFFVLLSALPCTPPTPFLASFLVGRICLDPICSSSCSFDLKGTWGIGKHIWNPDCRERSEDGLFLCFAFPFFVPSSVIQSGTFAAKFSGLPMKRLFNERLMRGWFRPPVPVGQCQWN